MIGHDGKGLGAGWFLDSIVLDVPSQGQQMKFSCNRWLAEDEDDGLIERELYASEENELTTSMTFFLFSNLFSNKHFLRVLTKFPGIKFQQYSIW